MSYKKLMVIAVGTVSMAMAQSLATTSQPVPPLTRSYMFLPVGLASTETVQVNVVNTAQASNTNTTAASCTGSISFLNASGAVIGKATSFTAASGQIVSVSLPYGSAGVTGSARTEIRAQIQLTTPTATSPAAIPLCSLSYSLETYDTATGVTHVHVPGTGTLSPPFVFAGIGR